MRVWHLQGAESARESQARASSGASGLWGRSGSGKKANAGGTNKMDIQLAGVAHGCGVVHRRRPGRRNRHGGSGSEELHGRQSCVARSTPLVKSQGVRSSSCQASTWGEEGREAEREQKSIQIGGPECSRKQPIRCPEISPIAGRIGRFRTDTASQLAWLIGSRRACVWTFAIGVDSAGLPCSIFSCGAYALLIEDATLCPIKAKKHRVGIMKGVAGASKTPDSWHTPPQPQGQPPQTRHFAL